MPRYFIWTIGCQMNRAESRKIAASLESAGYDPGTDLQGADLVVLNTCVVRQSAERKVLGILSLLKGMRDRNPALQVLVTGCFVEPDSRDLPRRFTQVDYAFRPGDYPGLTGWCQEQDISPARVGNPAGAPRLCALVPIIQGCDNFCSYCIVPYRRGGEVSRSLEEIVDEVTGLVGHGTREVTLLGQNVDSYGHDLPGHADLADLMTRLSGIDGLARIRFLTNHPKDISLRLIETIASIDKVCEHLELPVQSGDDVILRAMRRGYTSGQYRELLHIIRRHIPRASLSTDIIVGFPGETAEQFERTLSLIEEVRFDVVHVAAYSPRPGTFASREYEDDVPPQVKKDRLNQVETLQAGIADAINSQLQGTLVEILVEGKKKGRWFGRTRSDKLVFFDDAGDWFGRFATIQIERTSPWSLGGIVATDRSSKEAIWKHY
jgi:tRNA-2-methylthio-N6-dimethylallyladenosine synthase